jgi:hypothetical protein
MSEALLIRVKLPHHLKRQLDHVKRVHVLGWGSMHQLITESGDLSCRLATLESDAPFSQSSRNPIRQVELKRTPASQHLNALIIRHERHELGIYNTAAQYSALGVETVNVAAADALEKLSRRPRWLQAFKQRKQI